MVPTYSTLLELLEARPQYVFDIKSLTPAIRFRFLFLVRLLAYVSAYVCLSVYRSYRASLTLLTAFICLIFVDRCLLLSSPFYAVRALFCFCILIVCMFASASFVFQSLIGLHLFVTLMKKYWAQNPSTPALCDLSESSARQGSFSLAIASENLNELYTMQPLYVCPEDLDENITIQDNYLQHYASTIPTDIDENDFLIDCQPSSLSDPSYAPVLTMYKRVDKKVKPVSGTFPQDARVLRQFPCNPLDTMTPLTPNPPPFIPDGRLTQERAESLNINSTGFLWPEEVKLFLHVMHLNQDTLAFEETDRGTLKESYFSPYIIPTIPHTPWEYRNIPIPPGIREKVIDLLKTKINAGVYEPSQSAYRSRWFCVLKKNGKLRIVHDLQPLNKVSLRDAGLIPIVDDFVESFAGHQCYTVFDLFWGFDARKLHPNCRDLTAFLTPLGLLRLTSLPMGYTNAPTEFQKCTSFVLQDEIPHVANVFIDDLPIKGPKSIYPDDEGNPQVLEENSGIRRFIWEHAVDVHRVMHRIKHVGATFSATKIQICLPDVLIVGQRCVPDGRLPDTEKVSKILNWPIPTTVKEARGFMGLCGTVRIWILGFSTLARPITSLWKKDAPFIWGEEQDQAFNTLKERICSAPAMRSINYASPNPVILSVDSSFIAVGFILSQIDEEGRRRPARYGSLPMDEVASRYSQPKLELYGLYRALRHFRLHIIGVKTLYVEVDAKYIKGMLNEPDLQPNATINRWIQGILLFDFTLIHVPANKFKGPDALSRRPLADDEEIEPDEDSWLDEIALFTGTSQERYRHLSTTPTPPYHATSLPSVLMSGSDQEQILLDIFEFLTTLKAPHFQKANQRKKFVNRATKFFVRNGHMFKRLPARPPLLVVFNSTKRLSILTSAHEELGHKGEQATFETIHYRFYWPHLYTDVKHHVQSCHDCQIRNVKKMHIPITISTPATIFLKLYINIIKMPLAHGYQNLVLARDDLLHYVEGRALHSPSAKAMSAFFWEDIYCRYGAIGQIVTDNGPEVHGAFEQLLKRMDIPQIKISPYNSQANGVVERGHFNIREALVKSCKKKITEWPDKVPQTLFAENITTSRVTGFSPFYLLHGVHPVLPFDLTEATFMVEGFHANMDPVDFLTLRIRQLERRPEDLEHAAQTLRQARFKSKDQFERKFHLRLHHTSFKPGDLVWIRNTRIEKELNRKTKPRYLGPFVVDHKTKGGSYVLREMTGTLSRRGIAAFRLVPYISRNTLANALQPAPLPENTSSESQGDSDSTTILDSD